ncbi:Symplekin/PTA1 N-terminal [Popillia japonica]|uniref:Symplekin/PTA1 N-terminal n=1 Tax=Popillia japonica TaxID=7064 RepID=A0AAW1K0U8_POPJA
MEEFFNEEISDSDMLTQWFNTASVTQSNAERLDIFYKIQEVLVRKSPDLLEEFLPNILNFTTDKSADIKKALVNLIEEISKLDETYLTKVMLNLHMLLCDESIPVQKRVIQATITLYRRMLSCLCKASNVTKDMEDAWNLLNSIKMEIINMIDSDNDGIRTSAVKFLECVVLLQSYPDPNERKPINDFSLDDVPLTLKVARRRKLEEEANKIFALLIKFNGSQHISSANLFACIGALTNIGKHRPVFLDQVITAIEHLHSHLPPTLSTTQVNSVRKKLKSDTTQVNSVRKKLKSELMGLVKHPSTYEYIDVLTPMLIDLGSTQQDILKNMAKVDDRVKRQSKRSNESVDTNNVKKPRMDTDIDLDVQEKQLSAAELNEQFILDNLNKNTIAQIVMKALQAVPDTMPAQFKTDYADLLKHEQGGNLNTIAKQMAFQFVEAGVGPGSKIVGKSTLLLKLPWQIPKVEEKKTVSEVDENKNEKEKRKERVKVVRIKTLKLAEVTKPLEKPIPH